MAKQVGYGAFPGGDPRTFTPDPECSTDQEREAHRRACAIYGAHGRLPPMDPDHYMICDESTGSLLMHIARSRFGLGVYEYDDGEDEGPPESPPTDEAWDEEVLRGLNEEIRSALGARGSSPAPSPRGDATPGTTNEGK